jgi:hypothetical protein
MATTSIKSGGRIDHMISELERLHSDAQVIFDAHVDYLLCHDPKALFGDVKYKEIAKPAGSALNYIAALKLVRKRIRGEAA